MADDPVTERPYNTSVDLTWVEKTITVDAIADEARVAIEDNPGWRLIAVGRGPHEQTTLTFGWPWPEAFADE